VQAPSGLETSTPRLRQRVLESLAHDPHPADMRAPADAARERTGDLEEEVRVMNQELIPIVDDCYDQARERDPDSKGMLALEVRFASAAGVGGIIESIEPGAHNQLDDEELIECVRQSAYSIELGAPGVSGRRERHLTVRLGTGPDAARPE
jgi:hypothetical protein